MANSSEIYRFNIDDNVRFQLNNREYQGKILKRFRFATIINNKQIYRFGQDKFGNNIRVDYNIGELTVILDDKYNHLGIGDIFNYDINNIYPTFSEIQYSLQGTNLRWMVESLNGNLELNNGMLACKISSITNRYMVQTEEEVFSGIDEQNISFN